MSSAVSSVAVAGIDLPIADEMKVIGRSLAHIWQTRCDGSTSCNYHAHAIRHKRHLLTTELAQMFTCSLILSRLDYCNTVLYGALMTTINKLQRVQNNAGRLCCRCQNELMRSLYSRNYIGCPSNSASATKQLCSLSRFAACRRRHISTTISRHVNALEILGYQDSSAVRAVHQDENVATGHYYYCVMRGRRIGMDYD